MLMPPTAVDEEAHLGACALTNRVQLAGSWQCSPSLESAGSPWFAPLKNARGSASAQFWAQRRNMICGGNALIGRIAVTLKGLGGAPDMIYKRR